MPFLNTPFLPTPKIKYTKALEKRQAIKILVLPIALYTIPELHPTSPCHTADYSSLSGRYGT